MDAVLLSVRAALTRHAAPQDTLCAGLSGGLDSVVLLHALVWLRNAALIDHPLQALHVHHGLSPNADRWADFCVGLCDRLGVPLLVERACVVQDGHGLEAAARAARYESFARCGARWLLQGHHADDQVETMILRLSRGTGLRGIAGMPAARALAGGPTLLRPLLAVGRPQLRAHAETHRLTWIEDESNADIRLDRNYLRQQVMPSLASRFPSFRSNWLRAARHASEALELLDERAVEDAGDSDEPALDALRALSSSRLRNVLRWMVVQRGEEVPDSARLADIERCLRHCGSDAQLGIRIGRQALFHYRGRLRWAPAGRLGSPLPGSQVLGWQAFDRSDPEGPSLHMPGMRGVLRLRPVQGDGLDETLVASGRLRLHGAEPGEKLRLAANRPRRTLKNLWQEFSVPPWERAWLPRLSLDEQLIWVAGIGLDPRWRVDASATGWLPAWESEG